MRLKIHVDDLFICHVMGWKRILLNRVGGKLFHFGCERKRNPKDKVWLQTSLLQPIIYDSL